MTLATTDVPASARPRLLLATGWLGDLHDFDALRALLGDISTTAYEPDGLTASSHGLPWSFESSAANLDCILDEHPSIDVIAGSSIGGCMALAAATRHDLRGVIGIAAAPRWIAGDDFPFGFPPAAVQAVAQGLRSAFATTVREVMPAAYLDESDPAAAAAIKAVVVERAESTVSPDILISGLEASLSVDLTAVLGSIRCPVLLIGGERDHVVTPELLHWTAAAIPDCEVRIISGAGHLPHVTAPAAVRQAIAGFLKRIGAVS